MKSKVLVVVLAVVLLSAAGIYFFLLKNKGKETVSPVDQEQPLPKPTAAPKLSIWDDPAGFTFQYDSGLKIDNHPEDKVNYANLEITDPGKEGKILVFASDTKYKDVNEWVTKEAKLKSSSAVDSTLGGKPAKKVAIPDSIRVVMGAIDDKILFTIEMDPTSITDVVKSKDYLPTWQRRFNEIISSFEFVYPTAAPQKFSAPASSASEEDIIEEEEIVE